MDAPERRRRQLALKEQLAVERQRQKAPGALAAALAGRVPPGLKDTLERAFCAAFRLVFQKGAGVIEKTYSKEELRAGAARLEQAVEARPSAVNLRRMEKGAAKGGAAASIGTVAEGGVLGLLGIGLPDIPLFTAVLLRGVYQTALGYGFGYETNEERAYLLSVLCCALAEGEAAPRWAAEADRLARRMDGPGRLVIKPPALESYIAAAGGALAGAMLTAKFVQGLPIVGVAGGAANLAVYRQVLERARLKYQLRWLEKRAEAAGDQEQDRVEGKERWSF